MENQNLIVNANGGYQAFQIAVEEDSERVYRLYRFLTELEDLLAAIPDDAERIRAITPRVRQLLTSSYWLQMEYNEPKPDQGWAVKFLYREYQFPLTGANGNLAAWHCINHTQPRNLGDCRDDRRRRKKYALATGH